MNILSLGCQLTRYTSYSSRIEIADFCTAGLFIIGCSVSSFWPNITTLHSLCLKVYLRWGFRLCRRALNNSFVRWITHISIIASFETGAISQCNRGFAVLILCCLDVTYIRATLLIRILALVCIYEVASQYPRSFRQLCASFHVTASANKSSKTSFQRIRFEAICFLFQAHPSLREVH